jgi:hypothetical protein
MPRKSNPRVQRGIAEESVSIADAKLIFSKFKRTGEITPQDFKAVEAVVYGYNRRLRFANDWSITLPGSVRVLMRGAAALARAEGNENHARSLEVRLLRLPENSRYVVGRSRNGCSTGFVDTRAR